MLKIKFVYINLMFINCNWFSSRFQWTVKLYGGRKDTQNNAKAQNTQTRKGNIQNKKTNIKQIFLISSFRPVQNVVCFLLGDSPASPTFRYTLSVPSSKAGVK